MAFIKCSDCIFGKAFFPAWIDKEGVIQRVCRICWTKNWMKWMHPDECPCEHCKACREFLKEGKRVVA